MVSLPYSTHISKFENKGNDEIDQYMKRNQAKKPIIRKNKGPKLSTISILSKPPLLK